MVTIDIYFDLISPWHYIGKRRLESALRRIEGRTHTAVRWRPLERNPGMPPAGVDRRQDREARFGIEAGAIDAQIAAAGPETRASSLRFSTGSSGFPIRSMRIGLSHLPAIR